jgi:hypothetical protein
MMRKSSFRAKLPDNIHAHSYTFRCGSEGTWRRKWKRLKAVESNGKLPLTTCPDCSVPEPYRPPGWYGSGFCQSTPRAEYKLTNELRIICHLHLVFHAHVNEMGGSRSSVARRNLNPAQRANVTFWWCKWTVHKKISFTFCIKQYVFVISDNIQLVNLAPVSSGTFAGVTATISGTARCKCIAPFNLQSTDKEWLLYSCANWIWLKLHKICFENLQWHLSNVICVWA